MLGRNDVEAVGVSAHGPDAGRPVRAHHLSGGMGGIDVTVLTLGARLSSVRWPVGGGGTDELTIGHDDIARYGDRATDPYLGATVGRYANRISGAPLVLDGRPVHLAPNEGSSCLHGGPDGYDRRVWDDERISGLGQQCAGVALRLTSPDGDQGFPGTVEVEVRYVVAGNVLTIEHRATTTATTPLSLTNHTYWNLAGAHAARRWASVADHVLEVPASRVVPVGAALLPTGDPVPVAGTWRDLRRPTSLTRVLAAGGLDDCFVIDAPPGELRPVARLEHPRTGRALEVRSDAPAVQIYTAGGLDLPGARGGAAGRHAAVCIEPGHPPDAPHHRRTPSGLLHPGERYLHRMSLRLHAVPVAGAATGLR